MAIQQMVARGGMPSRPLARLAFGTAWFHPFHNPTLLGVQMTASKPPVLSAELRSLCGRLAVERTRRSTWATATDLRRQVLERLQRGESADALAAELTTAIAMASRVTAWPPAMETKGTA
jgi:hypothetical protein